MMKRLYALGALLSVTSLYSMAEEQIEAYKAPFYVGKTVMACGTVAQVSHGRKATYLNMDKAYPNQTLGLVIWHSDADGYERRFGKLDAMAGERMCGRGTITEYKNTLQIIMKNPQYLRLMK